MSPPVPPWWWASSPSSGRPVTSCTPPTAEPRRLSMREGISCSMRPPVGFASARPNRPHLQATAPLGTGKLSDERCTASAPLHRRVETHSGRATPRRTRPRQGAPDSADIRMPSTLIRRTCAREMPRGASPWRSRTSPASGTSAERPRRRRSRQRAEQKCRPDLAAVSVSPRCSQTCWRVLESGPNGGGRPSISAKRSTMGPCLSRY